MHYQHYKNEFRDILLLQRHGVAILRVSISGFKSIEELQLDLAPLTVLLGPPASGKSNILDALVLAGYLGRIRLLKSEYEGQAAFLEPLRQLARFKEYRDLFRYHDLSREIKIVLDFGDVTSVLYI